MITFSKAGADLLLDTLLGKVEIKQDLAFKIEGDRVDVYVNGVNSWWISIDYWEMAKRGERVTFGFEGAPLKDIGPLIRAMKEVGTVGQPPVPQEGESLADIISRPCTHPPGATYCSWCGWRPEPLAGPATHQELFDSHIEFMKEHQVAAEQHWIYEWAAQYARVHGLKAPERPDVVNRCATMDRGLPLPRKAKRKKHETSTAAIVRAIELMDVMRKAGATASSVPASPEAEVEAQPPEHHP